MFKQSAAPKTSRAQQIRSRRLSTTRRRSKFTQKLTSLSKTSNNIHKQVLFKYSPSPISSPYRLFSMTPFESLESPPSDTNESKVSSLNTTSNPTESTPTNDASEPKIPSLNKILASTGQVSRRNATQMIIDGKVLLNDVIMKTPTYKITPTDIISIIKPNGQVQVVHSPEVSPLDSQIRVIVLHKPVGYACSKPASLTSLTKPSKPKPKTDPKSANQTQSPPPAPIPTIYDILPKAYHNFVYVGRLDQHSSGLLLLTNKGEIVNQVTHPSHEIEKEYLVTTRQPMSSDHYELLLRGVYDPNNAELLQAKRITEIPTELFQPSIPQLYLNHSYRPHTYSIVLNKGFKREIRRMVAVEKHNQCLALHRIRTGNVCLGDLPTGKTRFLDSDEIAGLFSPTSKQTIQNLNSTHFFSSPTPSITTIPASPLIDIKNLPERHVNNYLPTFSTDLHFSIASASSKMPPILNPFETQTRVKS